MGGEGGLPFGADCSMLGDEGAAPAVGRARVAAHGLEWRVLDQDADSDESKVGAACRCGVSAWRVCLLEGRGPAREAVGAAVAAHVADPPVPVKVWALKYGVEMLPAEAPAGGSGVDAVSRRVVEAVQVAGDPPIFRELRQPVLDVEPAPWVGAGPELGPIVERLRQVEGSPAGDSRLVRALVRDVEELLDEVEMRRGVGSGVVFVRRHAWQEFNPAGNTCHFPGCPWSEEEHPSAESLAAERERQPYVDAVRRVLVEGAAGPSLVKVLSGDEAERGGA